MASNPKMEYQVFLCIFQKNSAMATLGLKEMGKFLWEGREYGGERNGHWINICTKIFISTHFSHRPRWPNWLGLHSANSMVVGSNPTASKFCYFLYPCPSFFPPFSLPSQRNFPISFKPKVAIAKF